MKRNTPKRAKLNRETDKLRREFVEHHVNCWVCGVYGTQCHEIGCHRWESIKHPETYFAACPKCHEQLHNYELWPIARQLAYKLTRDPWHFDLEVVNEIRGRAKSAIELWEVVEYIEPK